MSLGMSEAKMKIYGLLGFTHSWGRLITVMGPAGDDAVRAAIAVHAEETLAHITVVAEPGSPTQYHAKRKGALKRLIEAAGIEILERPEWDAQKAELSETP